MELLLPVAAQTRYLRHSASRTFLLEALSAAAERGSMNIVLLLRDHLDACRGDDGSQLRTSSPSSPLLPLAQSPLGVAAMVGRTDIVCWLLLEVEDHLSPVTFIM